MLSISRNSPFTSCVRLGRLGIHLSKTRSFSNSVDASSQKLVLFTQDPSTKTATISFNSPSTYNALTLGMGFAFRDQLQTLTKDLLDETSSKSNEIHALIVTGSGKAFSAGGDFSWLKTLKDNPIHLSVDTMYTFYTNFLLPIRHMPIPTIAALHGPTIGAAACIALACDMRVASTNVRIGFPFSKLGLHCGMGASHFLPMCVGPSMAKKILLTNAVFDSTEALRIGLIDKITTVPSGTEPTDEHLYEEVQREARNMGLDLSKKNPVATRTMLQTLRQQEDEHFGNGLETSIRREAYAQALCYARADWGEGIKAVIERRSPVFKGYHEK